MPPSPSTPSALPSRLWSTVPGSTGLSRASTAPTSPSPAPFPVSSSPGPSEGGDVEMDGDGDVSAASAFLELTDARNSAAGQNSEVRQEERRDYTGKGQEEEGELTESQLSRLTHVLERSALYSNILERQMREAWEGHALTYVSADAGHGGSKTAGKVGGKGGGKGKGRGRKGAKRRRAGRRSQRHRGCVNPAPYTTPIVPTADSNSNPSTETTPAFPQPHLITGATLHPYRLEGRQWMLGLDEQGISEILAVGVCGGGIGFLGAREELCVCACAYRVEEVFWGEKAFWGCARGRGAYFALFGTFAPHALVVPFLSFAHFGFYFWPTWRTSDFFEAWFLWRMESASAVVWCGTRDECAGHHAFHFISLFWVLSRLDGRDARDAA
ncbi:hypothetical protein B0H16DRAFT_1699903 [Mycena metata]|uniref:Uncharacterized protein n=1 Tax=Mycena metata TaxID=1033252 RepID=A0AAD7HH76_9AGAR|nr:hypothetical protein B0H16DRAFT_1699903 [Mycena metata]